MVKFGSTVMTIVSPGFRRLAVFGEQFPGHGDLLDVAFAVGVLREGLLRALRLGVLDRAAFEVLAHLDVRSRPGRCGPASR